MLSNLNFANQYFCFLFSSECLQWRETSRQVARSKQTISLNMVILETRTWEDSYLLTSESLSLQDSYKYNSVCPSSNVTRIPIEWRKYLKHYLEMTPNFVRHFSAYLIPLIDLMTTDSGPRPFADTFFFYNHIKQTIFRCHSELS